MRLSYDRDRLKDEFRNGKPFPFVAIDGFLDDATARRVAASYPTFESAVEQGMTFHAVNEYRKVQVTDSAKFPDAVKEFHAAISSPEFLRDLEYVTGIKDLLADPELAGGGMHLTGGGGRLDVHVDFNHDANRQLHRRLNLLVYLNPAWDPSWGGQLELWDEKIERCHHRIDPRLGRAVIFETSRISFHGVQPVRSPDGVNRLSFAAYFYTREAPPEWDGVTHSTIFRARPDEKLRRYVLMPLDHFVRDTIPAFKRRLKQRLLDRI